MCGHSGSRLLPGAPNLGGRGRALSSARPAAERSAANSHTALNDEMSLRPGKGGLGDSSVVATGFTFGKSAGAGGGGKEGTALLRGTEP